MLQIEPIPAFGDNYIWMLSRPGVGQVTVVDPGDEGPVLARLQRDGLILGAILCTHKHADHVGGIAGLLEAYPDAPVYGPANEPIRTLSHRVAEGDRIELPGLGLALTVLDVPGHTEGHVAYHADGVLFCGDTLFTCGCGRVFTGDHGQLHRSLQRLAALPAETLVYCAHEYTLANLGFAAWVEPQSAALRLRTVAAEAARARGEPTVPSTVGLERATNPFLRTAEPAVIAAAERWSQHQLDNGAAVFTALRTWKDREYD